MNICLSEHLQMYSEEKELFSEVSKELIQGLDGEVSKVFSCPFCDKKYLSKQFAINHVNFKHNISSQIFSQFGLEIYSIDSIDFQNEYKIYGSISFLSFLNTDIKAILGITNNMARVIFQGLLSLVRW